VAVPVAVVDANVLYSIVLTGLLLTLASRRLVRLHWSPEILDEVRRNLARRPNVSQAAIDYRIARMNIAMPSALDQAPAALVASMPINDKDRHVLALAVHVEAGVIVTSNLRDFLAKACAPYGVEAVSPDDFVVAIADADVVAVRRALEDIAGRRTRPPMRVTELLDRLSPMLPAFAERMIAPDSPQE